MNSSRIIGVIVLALVWCWLVWAMLTTAGGFTAKNVFLIVASGIIIFVPLWKKYFRKPEK